MEFLFCRMTTKNHFSSVTISHLKYFPLLYTWSITNKWQFSSLSLEHIGYYVLNHGMTFLQVSEFSFICLLLCRPLHLNLDEFYCLSSIVQHLFDLCHPFLISVRLVHSHGACLFCWAVLSHMNEFYICPSHQKVLEMKRNCP